MNCVDPLQSRDYPVYPEVQANSNVYAPDGQNYGYYANPHSDNQSSGTNYAAGDNSGGGAPFASRLNVPCTTYPNWNYEQCYGYYAPDSCYTTCQYVNVFDMEDFMNNEKRKEKSRDAARCRRSRETEIFTDLSSALPVSLDQVSQLDKASIMRLAIAYLKVRDMIKLVPETCSDESKPDTDKRANATESVFLKSIDGFVLVLSTDGDFVYVSENICDYLGITQIDLMGQNIYDFSHPCDHDEIKEMLSIKDKERYDSEDTKSFFLRLKCTLTSKGRSVNLKSATYKVINCTGHMLHATEDTKALESNSNLQHCLVAIGQPIPHPSNIEAPLPQQTFFTKHSLDMKFTYADEKMLDFLGYESEDLVGRSVYEYHHATDMEVISTAYKSLFSKGQCETSRYRFLAKTGGYVWVLTQATLIYDKVQKPESVVCVNFIISGVECKDEIYTAFQLEASSASTTTSSAPSSPVVDTIVDIVVEANNNNNTLQTEDIKASIAIAIPHFVPLTIVTTVKQTEATKTNEEEELVVIRNQQQKHQPLIVTAKLFAEFNDNNEQVHSKEINNIRPQTATSKIFAPRTEEMNKGFLTFSDEEPGLTLLKDEPDDLTHLAPVAGDVVSLETHPFLTDMLDDFLLKDGFCPLLAEEPQDPFIAYRDSCDPSPQLLSPNILKNSECSLPSLNSPSDSLSEEDQMTSFMAFPMEEDPELVMKAPYISMAIVDDLPLLNSEDLMWSNGIEPNRKTTYTTSSSNSNNNNSNATPENTSSLAELLSSSVNKHNLKNDHMSMNTMSSRLLDRINPYRNKNTTWSENTKMSQLHHHSQSNCNSMKRNCTPYDMSSKRIKSEPKDMLSSELLQQLISNTGHNTNNRRGKNKGNWLLDTGGQRKAACVSQPSESVLMNLLDSDELKSQIQIDPDKNVDYLLKEPPKALVQQQLRRQQQQQHIRKTSISLLDPEAYGIPSLLDLTQQDYEVNAPVCNLLLQGEDLITALNNDAVMTDSVI